MDSALDNFPILRQLNDADTSAITTACVICSVGSLFAVMAFLFLSVNTVLTHFSAVETQVQIRLLPPVFFIWLSLQLSIYYAVSRAFDADMRLINSVHSPQQYLRDWSIPGIYILVLTLALLAITYALGHIIDFQRFGFEPRLRFFEILNEGSAMIIIWYVLLPITSLTTSFTLLGFLKQAKVLSSIATDIPIKLQKLDDYQLLANMFVRIAISGLLIMSFSIASFEYADIGGNAVLLMLIVLLPLLAAFGWPIWVIRNRVQEQKKQTIENIIKEIENLDLSVSEDRGQHAYLLTRQMFVESRWEWPISSHVQKLIIFGLIPPLTWVLAALVENLLF